MHSTLAAWQVKGRHPRPLLDKRCDHYARTRCWASREFHNLRHWPLPYRQVVSFHAELSCLELAMWRASIRRSSLRPLLGMIVEAGFPHER